MSRRRLSLVIAIAAALVCPWTAKAFVVRTPQPLLAVADDGEPEGHERRDRRRAHPPRRSRHRGAPRLGEEFERLERARTRLRRALERIERRMARLAPRARGGAAPFDGPPRRFEQRRGPARAWEAFRHRLWRRRREQTPRRPEQRDWHRRPPHRSGHAPRRRAPSLFFGWESAEGRVLLRLEPRRRLLIEIEGPRGRRRLSVPLPGGRWRPLRREHEQWQRSRRHHHRRLERRMAPHRSPHAHPRRRG